jgi:predicted membrane-bound mannosyltransferase
VTGRHVRERAVKYSPSEVVKAVVGFVAPAAVVIGSSVTSASDGGSTITQAEIVTAVVAAIVTSAGVFGFKNKPAKGQPSKPDVSEAEADEVYPPDVPAHFDRPNPSEIGAAAHRAAEQARDDTPPENLRG